MKLKLTNVQLSDLVEENYYVIEENGIEKEIYFNEETKETLEYEGRHQYYYSKVVQRVSDDKYFRIYYSRSVKDTMDWEECNSDVNYEFSEVIPKVIQTTIYVNKDEKL